MITKQRLDEIFDIDTSSGTIKWKITKSGVKQIGTEAGSVCTRKSGGYRRIGIDRKSYWAHHIIWFYHYGQWPIMLIDHKNGMPADNRIDNLRLVTVQQNGTNRKQSTNNTSGKTGVIWHAGKKKWRAQIYHNNKLIHLGMYADLQNAIAAREKAEKLYQPLREVDC